MKGERRYRVNDDELLVSQLRLVVEEAYMADGQRVGGVLDATTITNIVLSITEGSDAIERAIERASIAAKEG